MAHSFSTEYSTLILCDACGVWCKLGQDCNCPDDKFMKRLERDSMNPQNRE